MKAIILSRLIRRVFVTISLTKSQTDVLNRFITGVLVFVVDDNNDLARRLHASYLSCVRDSQRHVRATDEVVQRCFDTCEFFSIALDTSLFGQDHVLVCTVRFAFDNKLEQFPLFVSVCDSQQAKNSQSLSFVACKDTTSRLRNSYTLQRTAQTT